MAERQQALAKVILQDPAVESLSSFIVVDGNNPTLNSVRFLINLKPLAQRSGSAADVIRRLQESLAGVEGIVLYMQPVQDLTIEDKVSRTQYQFSVEDAKADELAVWVPKLVERLRQDRRLVDVASDQQEGGLQAYVDIDRAAASRFGVTPAMIDNALYNAFGQRLVSTIFTQTNQYRVVLEVLPEFRNGLAALDNIYVNAPIAAAAAAVATVRPPGAATPQAAGAQSLCQRSRP
jgi:multidrug efflux pump